MEEFSVEKTRKELHINKTACSGGDETSRGWACLRSLESWHVWSSGEGRVNNGKEIECVLFRIAHAM